MAGTPCSLACTCSSCRRKTKSSRRTRCTCLLQSPRCRLRRVGGAAMLRALDCVARRAIMQYEWQSGGHGSGRLLLLTMQAPPQAGPWHAAAGGARTTQPPRAPRLPTCARGGVHAPLPGRREARRALHAFGLGHIQCRLPRVETLSAQLAGGDSACRNAAVSRGTSWRPGYSRLSGRWKACGRREEHAARGVALATVQHHSSLIMPEPAEKTRTPVQFAGEVAPGSTVE